MSMDEAEKQTPAWSVFLKAKVQAPHPPTPPSLPGDEGGAPPSPSPSLSLSPPPPPSPPPLSPSLPPPSPLSPPPTMAYRLATSGEV
eukprot:scaffold55691_cov50-Phaeocystis_antarctica.AAC.1